MALGELSFSTGLAGALGRSFTAWLPSGPGGAAALVAAAKSDDVALQDASTSLSDAAAATKAAATSAGLADCASD